MTTGIKVWRYNYRIHGKQKTFTIGEYPLKIKPLDNQETLCISLSEARAKCNEAKAMVKAGIDPSQKKQIKKKLLKENNFQAIAEKWLESQRPDWSESHHRRIKSYLIRDVYPWLGEREINTIKASEIMVLPS